jgi:hypothetical protein
MQPRDSRSKAKVINMAPAILRHLSIVFFGFFIVMPGKVIAQDTTKVRPEQVQSLLDDFHLGRVTGRVTKVVGRLGVEHLTDKEMALRKKFLGERLTVGFQKPFPIDRKEEHLDVEYRLKGELLLRGQFHRQDASQQGSVDLLFRHEY